MYICHVKHFLFHLPKQFHSVLKTVYIFNITFTYILPTRIVPIGSFAHIHTFSKDFYKFEIVNRK